MLGFSCALILSQRVRHTRLSDRDKIPLSGVLGMSEPPEAELVYV